MTDIGRAGMVMKGEYNSASTYETLDAVSYSNALYIAKQNVPAGTVPTNTTYWQEAIGEISTDITSQVTWDSTYLNIDMERSKVIRTGKVVQISLWATWKETGRYNIGIPVISGIPNAKGYLTYWLIPNMADMYTTGTKLTTYCDISNNEFHVNPENNQVVENKIFLCTVTYICE